MELEKLNTDPKASCREFRWCDGVYDVCDSLVYSNPSFSICLTATECNFSMFL